MPTGLGDEQLWISATNDNTGTSTAFNDQSGQGNNGTASGTLVVADTSSGGSYCFDFDGTNDYINCGSDSSLSFTDVSGDTAMAFSAWVNLASYSNNTNTRGIGLFGKGATLQSTADCEYMITCLDGKPALFNFPENTNGSSDISCGASSVEVPLSTWKHVAFTYSGCEATGCMSIYVDGVVVSTVDASNGTYTGMFDDAGNFEIGVTLRAAFDRWFYGKMDDIRVFDRVLTQAEITHLATSRGIEGSPGTPTTQYHAFVTHAFKQLFQTRLR